MSEPLAVRCRCDPVRQGIDRRGLLKARPRRSAPRRRGVCHRGGEAAQRRPDPPATGPLIVVTSTRVGRRDRRRQGARREHPRHPHVQGHPVRRVDRGRGPVHAADEGRRRGPVCAARSPTGRSHRHGPRTGWKNDEESFMFEWDDGQPSEDCLRVNVWTPGLDATKRPVMVWLHGGGFAAGSSQELKAYDGERLARRGDVVVVSRQPPPERPRLPEPGRLRREVRQRRQRRHARPRARARVGARQRRELRRRPRQRDDLRPVGWRREGEHADGDAGRQGAVPPRGRAERVEPADGQRRAARRRSRPAMLAELGLWPLAGRTSCRRSRTSGCWARRPRRSARSAGGHPAAVRSPRREQPTAREFAPVADGNILPVHPFDPVAPSLTANVPMLIGCCFNENGHSINHPSSEQSTEQEVRARVAATYGAQRRQACTTRTAALYPKATPFDVQSQIVAAVHRQNAVMQAERKAALGGAPVVSVPVRVADADPRRPAARLPLRRVAVRLRQHRPLCRR